jgi:peptidoglycan/xylan/chitin deacetylase (PgdA/CDA1 family)
MTSASQQDRRILYSLLARLFHACPGAGVPVLLYHRVTPSSEADSQGVAGTSVDEFDEQLEYLTSEGYSFRSIPELAESITTGRKLSGKAVAITFDDGFKDNFTHAFPLLRRRGIRACVFVNTGFIGRRLRYRETFWRPGSEKDDRPYDFMDWDELRELSSAGVDIQPHTHTHVDLTAVSLVDAEREIRTCRDLIEEQLNKPARHLSYPYGLCSEQVVKLLAQHGFASGWTVSAKNVTPGNDRFRLGRKNAGGGMSTARFKLVLSSHYNAFMKLKQILGRP